MDLYSIANEAIGIYPAFFGKNKRTEWQDGWNAYAFKLLDNVQLISKWLNNHPKKDKITKLLEKDGISIGIHEDEVEITYNSSDIFVWGYADCETITDEMIEDVLEIVDNRYGLVKYHCRKYNSKPQKPLENKMREDGEWDLEDLPECSYS